VGFAPGANTGDLIGAFEVVAVLRFGQPTLLGLALALKLAGRLGTVELMTKIAAIGQEHAFAMETLARIGRRGHEGPPRKSNRGPKSARNHQTNANTQRRKPRKKEEKIC
jgi:hypothetical protein